VASKSKKKANGVGAGAICLVLALTGCGSNSAGSAGDTSSQDTKASAPKVSTEPVTLTFYPHVAALEEELFQQYVAEPTKKKYPNITLEFLPKGGVNKIEEMIASNTIPDIIFAGSDNFVSLQRIGVLTDMEPLVKQSRFDLSIFAPESIQTLRDVNDGKLTAIPFSRNGAGLWYNKNIFDKFGVSYPTNGMTYDDVIAAARKITQKVDGTQYVGWEPGFVDANADAFSQPMADAKTKKALIDTPAIREVLESMKKGYDIPGFGGEKNVVRYKPDDFIGNKFIGMYVDWYNKISGPLIVAHNAGTAPDWDVVTVPTFPEFKGKGRHESVQFLAISAQSKYKDQAFQVIQAATSKDSQMEQSRNGRISILKDQEAEKQFGQSVPAFKGKHMENIFKFPPVKSAPQTIYDDVVRDIMRGLSDDIVKKKKDVNTALREAQAEADKKIADLGE
jgi:multiple sugar transport system substrate-binding protein